MTKVYGCSDDLVEFEGDVRGEVDCFGTDERDHGVLLVFSDGSLLEIKYGKGGDAVWGIQILRTGDLFDRVENCENPEAPIYSDVAFFKSGLKWCKYATEWGAVK
jgi:hypothetical protein